MVPCLGEDRMNVLAAEKVVKLFRQSYSPLYTGTVALEVSLSLDKTLDVIGDLVSSGTIRSLTDNEKKQQHIDVVCDVYALTDRLPR